MLLEGARRQSEMHGSIGGADKAGRDRGNGCIHGQAPGGLGSTGAVPPTEAGNGASGTRAGSDRLGGSLIVTPPSARSGSVVRRSRAAARSEEHASELQSLMRISYAVFCLKKTKEESKN